MAKGYDVHRLQLRRFELQMHYHAAYQFWNLKGVIAEKWGHGPHFAAYGETPTDVRLTVNAVEPSPLLGSYGLKMSAFIAEGKKLKESAPLAREWMTDCLTTLRPVLVNRFVLRLLYAYPVNDPDQVSRALADEYPGVAQLADVEAYEQKHGGLQAQLIRSDSDGGQVSTSLIFGVYGPHQEGEWFQVVQGSEGVWHLGFHYFRQVVAPQSGFSSPVDMIDNTIEESDAESWKWAKTSVIRVINRSERGARR